MYVSDTQAPLYTRQSNNDPERGSGTQIHYNSFSDFITAFEAEAKDPKVFGAADALDMINPLQHIPIISNLYRAATDDQIKQGGSNIIGGALFGGGIGLASTSVNNTVSYNTGRDVPETIMAALTPTDHSEMTIATAEIPTETVTTQEQVQPMVITKSDITWTEQPHQNHRSFYRTLAATEQSKTNTYQRIAMVDPERSAGSFVQYA
jgi:hypothetical protein